MSRYINKAGQFACEVDQTKEWLAESDNGTPFIRIPLLIVDDQSLHERRALWFGWLSEKAFDNTITALCKAFPDWDGDLSALVNGQYTFAEKPCEIVVEEFTFEGSPHFGATEIHATGHRQAGIEKKVLSLVAWRPGSKDTPERKKARTLAETAR